MKLEYEFCEFRTLFSCLPSNGMSFGISLSGGLGRRDQLFQKEQQWKPGPQRIIEYLSQSL